MKDLNHVGLDLQAPLELEFLDQALADEDLLVFVELLDDKLCHLLLLLSFIVLHRRGQLCIPHQLIFVHLLVLV